MLEKGEFIVRKEAAREYLPELKKMNQGGIVYASNGRFLTEGDNYDRTDNRQDRMYARIYTSSIGRAKEIYGKDYNRTVDEGGTGKTGQSRFGTARMVDGRVEYAMAGRSFAEQQKYIAEQERRITEPQNEYARHNFHSVNRLTDEDILDLVNFGDNWKNYNDFEDINGIFVPVTRSILKRTWSSPDVLRGASVDIIHGSVKNHSAGETDWNNHSIKVNIGTYKGLERFGEILAHEEAHWEQLSRYFLSQNNPELNNILAPAGDTGNNVLEANAQYLAQLISGTNRWGIGSMGKTQSIIQELGILPHNLFTGKGMPWDKSQRRFWDGFVKDQAKVKTYTNLGGADLDSLATNFKLNILNSEHATLGRALYGADRNNLLGHFAEYIDSQIKYNLLPPLFSHAHDTFGEEGNKQFIDLASNPNSKEFADFVNNRFVSTKQQGGRVTPRYATGGKIPGYGGGDKIPALLEAGEYVVRKEVATRYTPFLESMNRCIRGYKSCGHVYTQSGTDIKKIVGRYTVNTLASKV